MVSGCDSSLKFCSLYQFYCYYCCPWNTTFWDLRLSVSSWEDVPVIRRTSSHQSLVVSRSRKNTNRQVPENSRIICITRRRKSENLRFLLSPFFQLARWLEVSHGISPVPVACSFDRLSVGVSVRPEKRFVTAIPLASLGISFFPPGLVQVGWPLGGG